MKNTEVTPITIAVDFDGTLCKHAFPEIGEQEPIHENIMQAVIASKANGNTIILWTCREDVPERAYLTEAVNWCRERGLEFSHVNERPDPIWDGTGVKSRKLCADLYIDDRAIHTSTLEEYFSRLGVENDEVICEEITKSN